MTLELHRPKPDYPYTEEVGKRRVGVSVLLASFFPCCGCFIALRLLGEALFAGWDLLSIAFWALVIGGMALPTVVPLWLVALAMGIWFALEGRKAIRYGRQLTAGGVLVQAVIIDRWSSWPGTRTRCVAYRFETPAVYGSQTIVHAEYNRAAYHRYRVGARVSVRYLPGSPQICRLEMT